MGWTAPRTWVTGEKVTASLLNVQLRDNLRFLYTPPHVQATGTSNQTIDGNANDRPLEFGNVWMDNAEFTHGVPEPATNPNESRSAVFVTRIEGVYAVHAEASFETSEFGSRAVKLGRRPGGGGGWTMFAANTIAGQGPAVGPHNILPAFGLDSAGAQYQFAAFAQVNGTETVTSITEFNSIPLFTAHWMGHY